MKHASGGRISEGDRLEGGSARCAPKPTAASFGGTNSQWLRTEETRLQRNEPGRLKDHCQDGEQPNTKQHRGELHGVIS
jgi:hypothetical protein